ncbi:hypothetical protein O4215_23865 [Rhodococcus maanshanensis]|uniref:hypothetical protein n=1 Tax=Rhodococcus maanshanensis TaxID=183556 RepID=UPI0022B52950|nr:hypothetical protein [Rhodococcus maanshanensis]MCZ4558601.1 hypothetical protein [Rhodococcus maanshanensis]
MRRRLPVDPHRFLSRQGRRWWGGVGTLGAELEKWLADKRFADDVEVGLLFVPSVRVLDTRQPVEAGIRRQQHPDLTGDVFDGRLDAGVDAVPDDAAGAFFVTCVGRYGVSAGSYQQIRGAEAVNFDVADNDIRAGMTRQLWGARVLQAGDAFLPDCARNERWTFTVFAGEELIDGLAQSGTVLKSRVRFRLGKSDRGIGSARITPALFAGHL